MSPHCTDTHAFDCRSLLAGVVQLEAIQELCKLLVIVSAEAQKDFLGKSLFLGFRRKFVFQG